MIFSNLSWSLALVSRESRLGSEMGGRKCFFPVRQRRPRKSGPKLSSLQCCRRVSDRLRKWRHCHCRGSSRCDIVKLYHTSLGHSVIVIFRTNISQYRESSSDTILFLRCFDRQWLINFSRRQGLVEGSSIKGERQMRKQDHVRFQALAPGLRCWQRSGRAVIIRIASQTAASFSTSCLHLLSDQREVS